MSVIRWAPGMTIAVLEQEAIKQAYKYYQFNKTATARALEISVRTLDTKLVEYEKLDAEFKELGDKRRAEREEQLLRARGIHPSTPQHQAYVTQTTSGVHLQPTQKLPTEQPVSVPVRKEVQGVSPKQATRGDSTKGR